jgi:hypothetical protein
LLFWQLRAGPAAQLLAIPAAAWAAHRVIQAVFFGRPLARILGIAGTALLAPGAFATPLYPQMNQLWAAVSGEKPKPQKPGVKTRYQTINKANGRCRSLPALEVLNQLPPATIFTMVDLGPRLIATTHHSALAGPYHRNGKVILDLHHAFDGSPEAFRPIAARHHATYLLICPGFPEGTVYQSRSPRGFYAGMMRGDVPSWLHRVPLKSGFTLPYTLYRIDYSAADGKKVSQQR